MAKVAAARDAEVSSQEASSDEEDLEIDGVVAGTNGDATSAEEGPNLGPRTRPTRAAMPRRSQGQRQRRREGRKFLERERAAVAKPKPSRTPRT